MKNSTKNQKPWSQYECDYVPENHPFDEFIPEDAATLVIGTFPTSQSNARFKFYYGGEKSNFWPLMEETFNESFKFKSQLVAVEERKCFLKKHKIGMTDILLKCYRLHNRSGDEYLTPILFKNILSLLRQHNLIDKIILTSRTHIIGALGLFKTYLLQNNQELGDLYKDHNNTLCGHFYLDGRLLMIYVPISPSSRVEGYSFDQLVTIYRSCFHNP